MASPKPHLSAASLNMRFHPYILLLFLGILISADSIAQLRFQKVIRPRYDGYIVAANAISKGIGGGYLLGGSVLNNRQDAMNMLLMKTDIRGNVLWKKEYKTGLWESCKGIEQVQGGFVVLGNRLVDSNKVSTLFLK